jgi:xanthine dehydrogenase accessory factor
MTTTREQPWRDEEPGHGRIIVLTANPISAAIDVIATTVGREVLVLAQDTDGAGHRAFEAAKVGAADAVVVSDHDAPDASAVLRAALSGPAAYVAMMASRRRAERLLSELVGDGCDVTRLHVPAGLDLGGKGPGEIALSVVAEIVAEGYGRSGGAMRAASQ